MEINLTYHPDQDQGLREVNSTKMVSTMVGT